MKSQEGITYLTLPLYAQLKENLIAAISRGDYSPGDQLPSQRALCESYGMSHMTVRRAINELMGEGVIYAIPGKGIYVAQPKEEAESGPLISFTEDMAQRGLKASSRVLAKEIVSASTILAHTLEVEVGAPIAYLYRLRLANEEPIAIQTTYLPHERCPGILEYDWGRNSLYAVLRDEFGLNLVDSQVAVEASLADEEFTVLLQLTFPAALLITEQLTYLNTGQIIEFTRSVYRADRYRMRMR